jgi:taurine dioxygenase
MATATVSREVVKSGKALGAEIRGVDLSKPMDDATFAFVHKAWLDNLVIVVRGQTLDTDAQVAFGTRFGEPAPTQTANIVRRTEHPAIMYISNRMENGKFIDQLPVGEMQFHIDQCYIERPPKATILHSINIPSSGGDTIFSNHYLAYECLPEKIMARIAGRKVLNVYDYSNAGTVKNDKIRDDAPQFWHPLVRTHEETGRKCLFANRLMSIKIEGLEPAESNEILETLFEAIERPEHIWAHQWRVGDLLMWDNRCSSHARQDFPAQELRLMRRLTIKGERPV